MRIDRAGVPFVAAALVPAAVLAATRHSTWALGCFGLAGFFLFFFRDPERRVPTAANLVLSPADGRVMIAAEGQIGLAPPGQWKQVSIFLSPLDVHVNRAPVSGLITRVDHRPGRFLPAYRTESAVENERTEVWLQHGEDTVVFRQVVGVLARRVVCRVASGDRLQAGDRIGIMKFGSRMDVFLPVRAQLVVAPGDRVRGGETTIATLDT